MSGNGSTWKPDGSGWRARIGVLTHDDSAISESELWTMVPDGVSLHTSRVFFADLATFADPPGPDNATELLARLPLQAIIYAWTVGSYLLGTTGEEELVSRVETPSPAATPKNACACSPALPPPTPTPPYGHDQSTRTRQPATTSQRDGWGARQPVRPHPENAGIAASRRQHGQPAIRGRPRLHPTDSGVATWCGRWPGRSGHR